MEATKQVKMKKGITLIEIILAIVLIAIILGVTIPKLMSNSAKAEIKQVITSDVRSIVEAATTWRRSSSSAGGNYKAISASYIFSRLPSTMAVDGTNGRIYSSGLNVGTEVTVGTNTYKETGVTYTIVWQFDPATHTNTGRFSIGMDIDRGESDTGLDWNDNLQAYAKETFNDVVVEISNGQSSNHTASSNTLNASNANVVYDCSNGNITCRQNIQTNN